MSDTYDPNDMGYLRKNNEIEHSVDFSYNTYEPFGNIMTTRTSLDFSYGQLYNPRAFTTAEVRLDAMILLMNFWSLSLDLELTPWGEDDYFEPRTPDMSMFYHRPAAFEASFRGDTDRSKRFYIQGNAEYMKAWSDYGQYGYEWSLQPEFKVGRRFSFSYSISVEDLINDIGFVPGNPHEGITFGKRDVTTITNTISGAFIFSANSYLTLRGRHYWSRADYDGDYFTLQPDGSLLDRIYSTPLNNSDVNTNFLNIDVVYTWRFAPGSELSLVWKNSIWSEGDVIIRNGFDNFGDLLSMPQTNSLSLKILYYLDYQNFRKIFKSK